MYIFLDRVLAEIQKNKMLESGDKVLAGVSGGPDSVCLLDILVQLADHLGITVCVAHLNHMFRGQEAKDDAALVAKLAGQYGLPAIVEQKDVPAYMAEKHLSAQEAARILRYRFLDESAKRSGARRIALGHHADDQAETVLLNFLRGTGITGLKGMLPVRERHYIRPLLSLRKDEILDYCRKRGLEFRIDSSNTKPVYTRNLIRMKLLPLLESNYNENIVCNLNRLSVICRDEDIFLENSATHAFREVTDDEGDNCFVHVNKLLDLPVALQRRVIRVAFRRAGGPDTALSFQHVEQILAMAGRNVARGTVELPGGMCVAKSYGSLSLVAKSAAETKSVPAYCYLLAIPGATYIKELDLTILVQAMNAGDARARPDELPENEIFLDYDITGPELWVRPRRAGDVFNPLGVKGKVKLKKFFINCKIPASQRDSVPIFTNKEDIVWVGNIRPADKYKVSGNTKNILHIKLLSGKFR